ncbi:MAG: peptide deformylase [Bacteroidetes bacterium]|nr:peptide deformylase [Bacteroidota bacterium]
MIYPIVAYGDPVLKRKAEPIEEHDVAISEMVGNMFQTMYKAEGVGLAAPQVAKSIRLFIVDTTQLMNKDKPDFIGIKQAFVNPELLSETGEEWKYEEGCLSIPHIREDVSRQPVIKIRYFDEQWQQHEETFDGINARVIQHEYDHIEGVLFTDKINPLKKRLLQRKLEKISKGKVRVDYKMRFPALKRR